MAITRVHDGERGPLRPGDVVFHWEPRKRRFPLHVGIYVGREVAEADRATILRVCGLPDGPKGERLGEASWNAEEAYHLDIIGHRCDVDPIQLEYVVLLLQHAAPNCSQLIGETCAWSEKQDIRVLPNGSRVFVSGTCAHFVEYIYEEANLDLVDQHKTFDPTNRERLYPSIQIRAFWRECYPLVEQEWNDALAKYPQCAPKEPVTAEAGGSQ